MSDEDRNAGFASKGAALRSIIVPALIAFLVLVGGAGRADVPPRAGPCVPLPGSWQLSRDGLK